MISKILQNQDENNRQQQLLYSTGERRPSQRKSCGSHQMAFSTSSKPSDLLITNRLLPKRHSSLSDTSQIKISNSTCTFFNLYNKEQQECDSNKQQRNSSSSNSRRGNYWNTRKVMPDYQDSSIPSLNDCLSLSSIRSNGSTNQQQLWYGGRQKEMFDDLDHVLERYEKKKIQRDPSWSNISTPDHVMEETSSIGTTTFYEEESVVEEEEEDDKQKLVIALCDGSGNFLSVPTANDSPMNNFTSLDPIKSPRQLLSNTEDKSNSSSKEKSNTKNKKRPKSCKHRRKIAKKSLRRRSMFSMSQLNNTTTTDDSDDLMNNNNSSSKRCSTPVSAGVVSHYDVQGMQQTSEDLSSHKWDPHSNLTTQVQALGLAKGIMSDDSSSSSIDNNITSVSKRPPHRHRTLIRPTSSTARLSTATITNNNQQQKRQQQQIAAVSLYELPTTTAQQQEETETPSSCNIPATPPPSSNTTNKTKQQTTTPSTQQQQNNRNTIQQSQLLFRPLSSRTRRVPVQIIEDPFKRIEKLPTNWSNVEQQKVTAGGRGRSKRNNNNVGGGRNLNKRPVTAPINKFGNSPPFSTHVSIIKL